MSVAESPRHLTRQRHHLRHGCPNPRYLSTLPLLVVLQGEWARDMRIAPHQIHFEGTARQGKKATGGTWTRPDITAVSVRSFPHLPNKYLDMWTFDDKTVDWLDVTAIFEAAAHASRATRSYALLQVPEKASDRTKEILRRCEREATRLRVGLITFVDPARFGTWETVVDAPRVDTDPESVGGIHRYAIRYCPEAPFRVEIALTA